MKLLALDTSTDTVSAAVQHGAALWQYQGPGGAQSSATLVPALLALLEQAQLRCADLDAIVFGQGPGSFTGLRTACAVAQGLALGAGIPVLPMDSLLSMAEALRAEQGQQQIVTALDARMGEVYHSAWRWEDGHWQPQRPLALSAPEAVEIPAGFVLVGNAQAAYGEALAPQSPQALRLSALPSARAMLRLAPERLAGGQAIDAALALPLYVRDKVAQTTAERQAAAQSRA